MKFSNNWDGRTKLYYSKVPERKEYCTSISIVKTCEVQCQADIEVVKNITETGIFAKKLK